MMQAFIATLLIVQAASLCPLVKNTSVMNPWKFMYEVGDKAKIKCSSSYVLPWATSAEQTIGSVKCGRAGWSPRRSQAVKGFTRNVDCVACVKDKVDCSNGVCENGKCVCNDGYRLTPWNPRLCEKIRCSVTLANQRVEPEAQGGYEVGTTVKVTCEEGYHIRGQRRGEVEQTLTCGKNGAFDKSLSLCVVCDDDSDCENGSCNYNNLCECDHVHGYRPSKGSLSKCEKVECTENYCSNNGVCYVGGTELYCKCKPGFRGDTCDEIAA